MQETTNPLSWEELSSFAAVENDIVNGPNNAYSLMRLFNQERSYPRVVFYRDNHAWCPYCQKIWLWLESKKIPYQVKKVTMRCYGEKEKWYLKKVPSGMLPAIELDQTLITESDQILLALESEFGRLGLSLNDPKIIDLRNLERKLFRAWCIWLCNPSLNNFQESRRKDQFILLADEMNLALSRTNAPWIDPSCNSSNDEGPRSIDIVFIPYLERMNASLAYYKGFNLRQAFPNIDKWFVALERLNMYRATQGDFHTHAHDLPPQMGGCWINENSQQKEFAERIDIGSGLATQETTFSGESQEKSKSLALSRVIRHHENLVTVNPMGSSLFDQPLRAALTKMITGKVCYPQKGSAMGLRYLRDRISVPRDMPLLAARELRIALEETAQLDGNEQGPPIPFRNRFDQDPAPFVIDPN